MDGERTARALARIDTALTRIEAAAHRPAAPISADPALADRHAKLKGAVADSLRQLDDLISGATP